MSALSCVWQDSDVSLCNYLGCGKDEALYCLKGVVGGLDFWRREGKEEARDGGREGAGGGGGGGGGCSADDLPPTSSVQTRSQGAMNASRQKLLILHVWRFFWEKHRVSLGKKKKKIIFTC